MKWNVGVACLALTILNACALHYEVAASAAAVGADASIDAKEERDQGLTRLNIRIQNLAPAERVSSGASCFVVWQRVGDAGWMRVGALHYDENERTGLLNDASVPVIGFDLQVTAENGPSPTSPSKVVIVTHKVGG